MKIFRPVEAGRGPDLIGGATIAKQRTNSHMEISEIITYIGTALGSGGLVQLANWKWGRRKEAASVKSDEIETMKKAMEDFYDPLLKKQNARIAELEGEVKTLRDQLAYERTDKAARQIRNGKGQFTSEKAEGPADET